MTDTIIEAISPITIGGTGVPAEFQGPYDCYGHKIDQQAGE